MGLVNVDVDVPIHSKSEHNYDNDTRNVWCINKIIYNLTDGNHRPLL